LTCGARHEGLQVLEDILTFLDNHNDRRWIESNGSAKYPGLEKQRINIACPFELLLAQNNSPDEIIIVDYDAFWQLQFVQEAEKIKKALNAPTLMIEHIGSTAVPGLCAKPIIDILVAVEDLKDEKIVAGLGELGYVFEPDAGEPDRLFFCKVTVRRYHVHVVQRESWAFRRHILFRDYLISNPSVCSEYAALKRESAKKYRTDRAGYTRSKTEFIESALRRAAKEKVFTLEKVI
jgi:GrpB-like predicted nucleotidyltransferase (UPF0157 family)